MRAKEVMTSPVLTVAPDSPLKEAAKILADHDISALPVVDSAGSLVGIVSEADLLELGATPNPTAQITPVAPSGPLPRLVSEVMTNDVVTVEPDTHVALVAARLLETRLKRVPVLEGRKVVGIISRHDLIKVIARSDDEIATGVRRVLEEEGLRLSNLRVNVHGGVVALSGIPDRSTLELAEIVARGVPGVLEVRIHPS